jgi:hypothetical protein
VTRPYRVHEPLFAQQLQQYEQQQQQQQSHAHTTVPHTTAAAVVRCLRRPASAPAGRRSDSPMQLQQHEHEQQQQKVHRQHTRAASATATATATAASASGTRNRHSAHSKQHPQHQQQQQRQRRKRHRCAKVRPTVASSPLATVVHTAGHGSVAALYGRLRTYEGCGRLQQRGVVRNTATTSSATGETSSSTTTTTAQAQFESDAQLLADLDKVRVLVASWDDVNGQKADQKSRYFILSLLLLSLIMLHC